MSSPKNAYFQGKIVPYSQARVGVLTHALNYGTAAFAGIRAYWNDDQQELFIFRPVDHLRRLINASKMLLMKFEHTPESLTQIIIDLLCADGNRCDVYIRPLVFKADEGIGVKLHDMRDELAIAAFPYERYLANDANAHVTISSWRRVDDNMIPARGKISGAYANSALIKSDAVNAGFDEALVLTQDGHISEASAMNVFMLRDGALITPPITENILEGITRNTVIDLARKELGLTVIERSIDRTEVFICDELFLAGTAAQITVVTRVDYRAVGSGLMGPVAARLRGLYDDLVRGRLAQYRHWNVPVYGPNSR